MNKRYHTPPPQQLNDFFTPHRAVQAEGARIGFVSCLVCGATVTLDRADDVPQDEKHLQWHRAEGHLRDGEET